MYLLKRIIATMLLLIAVAITALADGNTYYVAVNAANVRREPNKDSDENIITTLLQGEDVTATGKTDGLWIQIDRICGVEITGDGRGDIEAVLAWIYSPLLSLEPKYDEKVGIIESNGWVNLRDNPSGASIKRMESGDEVKILAVVEVASIRWFRVLHGGTYGFVMAEYVQTGGV